MFAILLGVAIGAGLSFQTAINARLRGFVGSPFTASMVSFSVGTLFLLTVALLQGQSLLIDGETFNAAPWWVWIGGFLGVIGLTTNILLFPYLGGVQTAIMPILGQILMGMLIDNFGWFHSARKIFGWNRAIGAVLVLSGIFLAVALPAFIRRKQSLAAGGEGAAIWLWRALGVAAGMASAAQTAINGELGRVLHSSVHSAFVSFLVGMFTLIILVNLRERRILTQITHALQAKMPWWIWLGGALGGIFVFGSTLLVPMIGTGQTVVLTLLGMIGGSLCVDQFGLLGAPKKAVSLIQLIGLAMLIAGVGLIRMF